MFETPVTIVGNVIDPPKHRRLPSGASVTNFRVASTARKFDRTREEWVDGDSLFVRVTCWRQLADNTIRSVFQGDPVIVTGRLCTKDYEVDGQRRSSFELDAQAVGPNLARGLSEFTRNRSVASLTTTDLEELAAAASAREREPELAGVGSDT
ncbi:MAG: single-stranded DNA-binding protein [Corynebacteriales bacterium]|nr:single-stranded DNA-binding protein [Mycobacteriales bacterium]